MLIEKILPMVVAQKSTLYERLLIEARILGLSDIDTKKILSNIPRTLIDADSFLDKMTNLWRYEFGIPYDIGKNFVWGTHMWVPVHYLLNALTCAYSRLPKDMYIDYLKRLSDPSKHQDTIVEMIPGNKIDSSVAALFEVPGLGIGNKTIDWVVGPYNNRTVLMDVKRRTIDFIKQVEKFGEKPIAPKPDHDPTLLFRSLEDKFQQADPNFNLQGVWIVTDIKQNKSQLSAAFAALNSNKVHFAILGDWEHDAYILVARNEDEQFLRELFHIQESLRFTFS